MEHLDEFANKEARNWAMVSHLAALLLFTSIPFANILGPLVVWMVKKDEHPFVDEHGREAINFQISMTIYLIIPVLLCFILIGIPIVLLMLLADIVLTIIAAMKAMNGESFTYPLTIRFINKGTL